MNRKKSQHYLNIFINRSLSIVKRFTIISYSHTKHANSIIIIPTEKTCCFQSSKIALNDPNLKNESIMYKMKKTHLYLILIMNIEGVQHFSRLVLIRSSEALCLALFRALCF